MSNLGDHLAALNATLNGTSAILISFGWYQIRFRKEQEAHRKLMLSAIAVSAVFLVSYLTRVAISGIHPYPGHGAMKALYLTILGTHVPLAILTVPLVLYAVFLAINKRFAEHRRLVRYTFPIWLYVSVTGVLVYVMLYQALPPGT